MSTRLLSRLCFLGVLSLAAATAAASERACTIHDGNDFFDLSKLSASKDYEFTTPSGYNFVLNVCKSVSREVWNIEDPDQVGAFIRRDHGDFSIGQPNTTLAVKAGQPLLYMGGGSKCRNSEMQATTAIQFMCDASVFAAGKPELIAQVPDDDATACAFFIEWRTHLACPSGETGFMGAIMVVFVTVLVLGMLFFVCVILYNHFALKRRGLDQMPSTIPLPYTITYVFGLIGDFFSSLFSRIPSRSGPNPVSHHWDSGLGGSRFGSGARRDEEEAMLVEGEANIIGENPWGGDGPQQASGRGGGMDSDGVIRL